jgi:putative membrane-bound dehydrogenase-like protein
MTVLTAVLAASGLRAEEKPPAPRPPLRPDEALESFRLDAAFRIELVAAEPLIADPVSIAWDAKGRLWVVEMADYPTESTGGRIRILGDADGDGRYDRASVFHQGLPFPTSVLPYRRGCLACAGTEILYLDDGDGDGKADSARAVIAGFADGNTQLRANGLLYGLDNRIYGANGRSGGRIRRAQDAPETAIDISRADFRFLPESFEVEAIAGPSQFGHAFDDWGRRFLSWNTVHIRQELLSPRDLERNPRLLATSTLESISDHGDASRIYPLVPPPPTFNNEPTDHFNASCGLTVERGGLFPPPYAGNAFVCEPLTGIVHRDILEGDGPALAARRGEDGREFLASTDPWFHPVFLRSGPDGALYVVDFYRELVEHPHYVPAELRGRIDFRRGHGHGRIYRILPKGRGPFSPIDLDVLAGEALVEVLEHPNGPRRDAAQRLLAERREAPALPALMRMALTGSPRARAHALWTLDGLGRLDDAPIHAAFASPEPQLRAQALRLVRERGRASRFRRELRLALGDASAGGRFLAVLAMGDLPRGDLLDAELDAMARAARDDGRDRWFRSALLSSLAEREAGFLARLLQALEPEPLAALPRARHGLTSLVGELAELIGAAGEPASLDETLRIASGLLDAGAEGAAIAVARGAARGLARKSEDGGIAVDGRLIGPEAAWRRLFEAARSMAAGSGLDLERRLTAIALLGHGAAAEDASTLRSLLEPQHTVELQIAAARALCRRRESAEAVFDRWDTATPALRAAIVDELSGRTAGAAAVLRSIELGRISLQDLSPPQRKRLAAALGEGYRDRLGKLESAPAGASRRITLEYLESIKAKGDAAFEDASAERGRLAYVELCAPCHKLRGEGHDVGPDLSGDARKSIEELVAAVFDPSRSIASGYTMYNVVTAGGRVLQGLLVSETANAITVRWAGGVEEVVPRTSVRELRAQTLSLMPENLEASLSVERFLDLLAYLRLR